MRQRGVVIQKQGKTLQVKIEDPASTCGNCKGCIRLTPEREHGDYIVSLRDSKGEYDVGDELILEGKMAEVAKALGVLYGIPFLTLFLGYVLTNTLLKSDPLAGLGAVVGLLLGAMVARPLVRKMVSDEPEFTIVARACS